MITVKLGSVSEAARNSKLTRQAIYKRIKNKKTEVFIVSGKNLVRIEQPPANLT